MPYLMIPSEAGAVGARWVGASRKKSRLNKDDSTVACRLREVVRCLPEGGWRSARHLEVALAGRDCVLEFEKKKTSSFCFHRNRSKDEEGTDAFVPRAGLISLPWQYGLSPPGVILVHSGLDQELRCLPSLSPEPIPRLIVMHYRAPAIDVMTLWAAIDWARSSKTSSTEDSRPVLLLLIATSVTFALQKRQLLVLSPVLPSLYNNRSSAFRIEKVTSRDTSAFTVPS